MSSRYLPLLLLLSSGVAYADYDQDVETITKLAGCFETEVEFTSHPSVKKKSVELVILEKEDSRKLSLVHLLLPMDGSISNLRAWRQTWVFEGIELFQYLGDYQWKKYLLSEIGMKGHWVEKITHLDGSPERQCVGEWIQHPYYSHWKCTARGPLPERDFGRAQGFDYTIQVHDYTLLANEVPKVLLDGEVSKWKQMAGREEMVVTETSNGFSQAIDSYFCNEGRQWWESHQNRLEKLTHAWDTIYAEFDLIRLKGVRNHSSKESLELWKNVQTKSFRYITTKDQETRKSAWKGWSEYWRWFPAFTSLPIPKSAKEWIQEDWVFSQIRDEDRATLLESD